MKAIMYQYTLNRYFNQKNSVYLKLFKKKIMEYLDWNVLKLALAENAEHLTLNWWNAYTCDMLR